MCTPVPTRRIISCHAMSFQIIKQEAIEMRDEFGTPRRTRIETDLTSADVDPASLIPNSTILIVSESDVSDG